ncbi:Thiol-disulfide oxidoreductase ResA [termite gut metagenome]|uniref:Thiol-disulfide oxidoreductase ResA n=1 Tax=termite gut metagenome TaxID=433724 RepID=A0A5J4T4A8_9ZZZZ
MKKFVFLIAVMAIVLISCNQTGYTITGTIKGSADGDVVYLQSYANRLFDSLDSAIINNGSFTFKGVQDSAVNRYLSYKIDDKQVNKDFFLENGKIKATLEDTQSSITGTPLNDAYQTVKDRLGVINSQQASIYESVGDSTLTDEQKGIMLKEIDSLDYVIFSVIKEEIKSNITNAVGLYLAGMYNYFYTESSELDSLLSIVPENLKDNETIVRLTDLLATLKVTDIGQKFIDLEVKTPNEKLIKLSDYAGKGKVVLIDFWASWCPPCRDEMPNLVKVYNEYKKKGFEIVGISLDSNSEAWKNGIKQLNITWPQMSDLKGWSSEGAKLYGVRSIPQTILIDKEGAIIAKGLRGEELQKKLAEIL